MFINEVTTMGEAQSIRRIRNSFADRMTHDTRPIRDDQQAYWFKEVYQPAHRNGEMTAYVGSIDGTPMAYGMVSRRDDKLWLTGGIREIYRGEGYGEDLFRHLADIALEQDPSVYLDVLDTNTSARNLYRKLGFNAIQSEGGITVMERTNA